MNVNLIFPIHHLQMIKSQHLEIPLQQKACVLCEPTFLIKSIEIRAQNTIGEEVINDRNHPLLLQGFWVCLGEKSSQGLELSKVQIFKKLLITTNWHSCSL